MKRFLIYLFFIVSFMFILSCEDEKTSGDLSHISYNPQEYVLNYPDHFPRMNIPADNPMTKKGVELGRFLFFDPILSIDSTISCSSCHDPSLSFTDGRSSSIGVNGTLFPGFVSRFFANTMSTSCSFKSKLSFNVSEKSFPLVMVTYHQIFCLFSSFKNRLSDRT